MEGGLHVAEMYSQTHHLDSFELKHIRFLSLTDHHMCINSVMFAQAENEVRKVVCMFHSFYVCASNVIVYMYVRLFLNKFTPGSF